MLGGTTMVAVAQDATWLAVPGTDVLNESTNWNGGIAPGSGDTAFFGASTQTNLVTEDSEDITIGGFTFTAGAPDYTLTMGGLGAVLQFDGAGIMTDDAEFTLVGSSSSSSQLTFLNTSTAGEANITNNNKLVFEDGSSAGPSFITNNAELTFQENSTAGSATITNFDQIEFFGDSSAGNATITNENGDMDFLGDSTAGTATITNKDDLDFRENSTAGNARLINENGATTSFNGTGRAVSAGSISGGGFLSLGGNAFTVGNNDDSTLFSGVISGSGGSLTKTGIGTLTLSGTNTYSGGTIVSNGGLIVDGTIGVVNVASLGILGGVGTLGATSVSSGGVHTPGNSIGTQTVNGNYTLEAGSVLEIEVDATGQTDQVDVTGEVSLDGATLRVLGLPDNDTSFGSSTSGVIIANDGVDAVSGVFSIIENQLAFYDANVDYTGGTGNDVVLDVTRNATSFEDIARNENQTAIAEIMTSLSGTDSDEVVDAILGETVSGAQTGLDQLSPEIFLNTSAQNVLAAAGFIDDLFSCPVASGPHAMISEQACFWLRPEARFYERESTSDYIGFSGEAVGVSIGGQIALDQNWYAGFAFGYEQGALSTNTGASSDSLRFNAGGIVKYHDGPLLLASSVSAGIGSYETVRQVSFGGLDAENKSDSHDGHLSARFRATYLLEHGAYFAKPSVDLTLTYLHRDAIMEDGNAATALNIDAGDDLFVSVTPSIELGANISSAQDHVLRAYAKAGVTFYTDDTLDLTALFAGGGVNPQSFKISSVFDSTFANLETGVMLFASDTVTLSAGYQGQLSKNSAQHGGFLKTGFAF